ncbi:MAG: CHAT domain-containing protein [Anaerolineales bacterium]|nr:CHAT domain-containing protein [Anaerolineales bacterium]
MAQTAPLIFDLRFERTTSACRAQVIQSPFGQAAVEFSLPLTSSGVGGSSWLLPHNQATARQQGTRLFETVFAGETLALLRRSLDEAERQQTCLRLLLRFGSLPELAALPWEFLYDPAAGGFLALLGDVTIARYLEVPQPHRPITAARPLNVLVAIASPANYPVLDIEGEWNGLKSALSGLEAQGLVRLERLQPATALALQRRLRQADFHVLHFIGHGAFDENIGEGVLVLDSEPGVAKPGQGQMLSSQHLTMLVGAERRSLGLVMLNACQTAQATAQAPFAGMAQSLVRLGIPAVIAQSAPIVDKAAAVLSAEFYLALAEGQALDFALAEGRKAMVNQGFAVEWGIPVLFLHATSDGRVFDVDKLDLPKVVETLKEALPANDPTPDHLLDTLRRFEHFHTLLHNWKELHNLLNDIIYASGQFSREIERLDASGDPVIPRSLNRLWRPVAQKVSILTDWAASARPIADTPFQARADGLQGPAWAVELHAARVRLDGLLEQTGVDQGELYDATFDFVDLAEKHMYLADKQLRDTAGELSNLSRMVLGRLTHDKVH